MSRQRRFASTVVTLVAVLQLACPARAAKASPSLSVSVDRTRVSTVLGSKFQFRSTITNRGPAAASGLIAHLNVLSLRPGPYVDPEDWSASRTRYLGTIAPGRSVTTAWQMQAVNHGIFGVYVAVLDADGRARPTSAPTIRLAVAERKTLNSGGIVPLAVGIPALLGLLTLGFRLRRRG
jgi:hypothetical protein